MIDVLNQPEEAIGMLRRADDLEEAASKAHRDAESNANGLLDDKLAIITITSQSDRLGDIVEVNTGVVRMFGHSRSELLALNVDKLMPQPYSFVYLFLLFAYIVLIITCF